MEAQMEEQCPPERIPDPISRHLLGECMLLTLRLFNRSNLRRLSSINTSCSDASRPRRVVADSPHRRYVFPFAGHQRVLIVFHA